MTNPRTPDLYKQAGVDVEKGDRLVDWLLAEGQDGPTNKLGATVSGIGGFAGLFRPNFKGMEDPLLVSGTDGVGTKVLLGLASGRLEGLGQDLVAMCVNDLYTIGARPLFFLDYYATGVLDEAQFKSVLTGIKKACRMSDAALLGGETAELPGLYEKGHFDLAGFVVGAVDGKKVLGPDRVQAGDVLFSFPSSGFHSNGYSLVRKFLDNAKPAPSDALIEKLMIPTRIYSEVPALVDRLGPEKFHALAHITGGGISGNLPRVLPKNTVAALDFGKIVTPAWMRDFIEQNGTTTRAQEAVFNLGVGMIAAVAASAQTEFAHTARALGIDAIPIGHVEAGAGEPHVKWRD
jgi:phosphoribosylformylglycinamidine cyclo-ligase